MRLLVVNPNTTESMTRTIGAAARRAASPGVEVEALSPDMGPASIEGFYDEAFAVPGLIAAIERHGDRDAYVVGCFDDTGLDAARTVTRAPVVGLCQASLQVAATLGSRAVVVTTLARSVPALEHLVARYGMAHACAVHACDIPVLGLESPETTARLTDAVAHAIESERAEVAVLGCAGMTAFAAELTERFARPVLDPVACAVRIAEALAGLGVETSKAGGYAEPLPKPYSGSMSPFAPGGSR